jgi:hypothetical protein
MLKIGKHRISLFWGDIVLSKNKSFEYQIDFGSKLNTIHTPFELSLKVRHKMDHAGIDFIFSVYKMFWMNLNIHDHRHWDYENDCWK